jgi:uncharacterized protein (TIRG00374 family)
MNTIDKPSETKEQSPKQSIWKQALAFVFAAFFLWLAFKDANPQKVWQHMQGMNASYLIFLCFTGVLSHLLRAVRWLILLGPLAEGRKLSLWNSFCAVIYGYAVNVVIPRGGEVARLVSICKTEKLPWAGVLPTMLIDRLLDIAALVFLIGLTLSMLPAKISAEFPWLTDAGRSMAGATIIGLLLLPWSGKILKAIVSMSLVQNKLPEKIKPKLDELIEQFNTGTRSLSNPLAYPGIALLSVAIWFLYWFNFYLMFGAFNLLNIVDLKQCLIIFTIGTVGVLVPTPGSVGTFHYFVSEALRMTLGMDPDQARAFAAVLHFFTFIVVTIIPAAFCFLIQTQTNKKLKAADSLGKSE